MPIVDGKMELSDAELEQCTALGEHFSSVSPKAIATVIFPDIYVIASELLMRGLAGNIYGGGLTPVEALLVAMAWGIYLGELGKTKMLGEQVSH